MTCALANTTRQYESLLAHRFPGTHVAEVLVIALCFAFFGLAFLTEVATARFFTMEGIQGEDFGEFEEVSHAAGTFEVLVEGTFGTEHVDVLPEFFAESRNLLESSFQTLLVTSHAHVFPHDVTEFTMDIVNSAVTLDGEELVDAFFGLLLAVFEGSVGLLLMGVSHTVVWVGLYSGGNRLRLRLPLTSQNQAPLRGSCPQGVTIPNANGARQQYT